MQFKNYNDSDGKNNNKDNVNNDDTTRTTTVAAAEAAKAATTTTTTITPPPTFVSSQQYTHKNFTPVRNEPFVPELHEQTTTMSPRPVNPTMDA